MMKNLLYLVDTQTIDLIVTLFIVTINKNGNLILRYVSKQGPLSKLKNFYTKDAFLAVKECEYQSKDSQFIKSVFPKYAKQYTVAAIVYDEENLYDYNPFGIHILKNNMVMKKPELQPIKNNDYVVLATLNSSYLKADNDTFSIISGDSKNCEYYEFVSSDISEKFSDELPKEKNKELSNIIILKRNKHTEFGDFVIYEKMKFDQKWRRHVLCSLNDFFLDDNQRLIPRLDGSWNEEYIEGLSFPYFMVNDRLSCKKDWEEFLSNPNNFPIEFGNDNQNIKKIV